MTTPAPEPVNILIVDDEPANLDLLADILRSRGYHSRRVLNARAALTAAAAQPPDLILLDINLPDMDGYTLCEQLKANPALAPIPVIFISALTQTIDKVRAFSCGGVDYVTKPVQVEEVEARIGAQLRLRRLQRELAEKNESLAQSLDSLKAMEQLRDNLVHMVVHDIRSPLSGILLTLELLLEDADTLPGNLPDQLRLVQRAAREVTELAVSMLELSRIEAGKMPLNRSRQDLAALARDAAAAVDAAAATKKLSVVLETPPCHSEIDPEIVRRILVNILNNAIRFTPATGTVRIVLQDSPQESTLHVHDEGPGIPAELHGSLFQKFGDRRLRQAGLKQSVGLGLAFCKLAVEAHGGRIGVESQPGQGSAFWFTLPHVNPVNPAA